MLFDTHLTHISPFIYPFSTVKLHASSCIPLLQEFMRAGYPRRILMWIKDAIKMKKNSLKQWPSLESKEYAMGWSSLQFRVRGSPFSVSHATSWLPVLTALREALFNIPHWCLRTKPTHSWKKTYLYGNKNDKKFTWKSTLSLLRMTTSYHRFHLSRKPFLNPTSLPFHVRSLLYILIAFCPFSSHHLITAVIKYYW